MPKPLALTLLMTALALGMAGPGRGQDRPHVEAVRMENGPQIDGDVLDDPFWSTVPATTGFTQTRPYAGQPASEKTEVRVAFTASTLYFGVVCFDREPDEIIVSDSRRDASLDDTDSFRMIIDAFRDGQNGYVFGTNPAGIEYDGQLTNESAGASIRGGGGGGGGPRSRRGSGGGFNINWDGSWTVATRIAEYGWSAEFAIPFSTLRFPTGRDASTWGINFQRIIRRRNETSFWSPLEQQFNLYRLTDAGTVGGLEAPRPRNLKLVPYAKYTLRRPPVGDDSLDDDLDGGLDLKYSLTPSLTLDATYNTDFAEVEVDEQQVNLDRFNLFFPEKRPFFLENAGLFSVGATAEAELFFSRRIGISEDGDPIPIEAGGRITGKVGRTNVGLMYMQTEGLDNEAVSLPGESFAVVRASRELPNRSNLGFLAIGRKGRGGGAPSDDRNETYGIDGKLGIGEYQNVKAWAAVTDTPDIESDDHAFELEWELGAPLWSATAGYLEVGKGFNPEVGFLSREDFRKPSFYLQRRIRPEHLWGLTELRPHISYQGYWDSDGFKESERVHLDNHWDWRNGTFLSAGYNYTFEGVKEAFEIYPDVLVQPGEYPNGEGFLIFNTDRGAAISWSLHATVGGFFGGSRVSLTPALRLRRSEALTSEIEWEQNDVRLPEGDFTVNLGRLRVSYSPTPHLLLQLLTQYNDRDHQVSTNLRFSWLRDANTGLFVVYNEIDEFGSAATFERADRSLIVKYSYTFDVFR